MPELPEVETIVRGLREKVIGKQVTETLGLPFGGSLTGKRIAGVKRRGKYILLSLDDGSNLLIHLGMTGRLLYSESDRELSKHTRVLLIFANGSRLRFDDVRKFGKVKLYGSGEPIPEIERLGMDPLEPEFSPQTLTAIMKRTRRKVKDLLMDQRAIAGIGNIYSQEILSASKVSPFAVSCSLPQHVVEILHNTIRELLHKAIDSRGTTFSDYSDVEGREGSFQNCLQIYRKEICPHCGGAIEKVKLSGRSTYYCPRCQGT